MQNLKKNIKGISASQKDIDKMIEKTQEEINTYNKLIHILENFCQRQKEMFTLKRSKTLDR